MSADAAAFAAADDEECTRLLKEKVLQVFKAAGVAETDGLAKQELLKYALGLVQTGQLRAFGMPDDAPELVQAQLEQLFANLDANADGKVMPGEAYSYALNAFLEMSGVSSIALLSSDMKLALITSVSIYGDMLTGASGASGSERFQEITKLLKAAFDAADLNGNGYLERDELKAGCLVIAKSVQKMMGDEVSLEEVASEMESSLDGFIESVDKEKTGKVRFEDIFAAMMPALCEGNEPEEFFSKMEPTMFSTIKMQIDMYLGGFTKIEST